VRERGKEKEEKKMMSEILMQQQYWNVNSCVLASEIRKEKNEKGQNNERKGESKRLRQTSAERSENQSVGMVTCNMYPCSMRLQNLDIKIQKGKE
jgi:hypothetical protein